ncbi:hypothetical protein B4123_1244 [Bacillus paralicheniformis]|nr:hypothetical protein B4123_1557 [Bacillus paralicheniformis]OLG12323.1 hypothetical protein B4123_1244 [Bacillus paralicheniformis]
MINRSVNNKLKLSINSSLKNLVSYVQKNPNLMGFFYFR